MKQPLFYLALDTPDLEKAKAMARQVNDVRGDFGYKVNLDLLVLDGGRRVVTEFREEFGRSIFTDTKTWNGGRTMAELAVGLAQAGSSLVNIYAHSGVAFMRKVMKTVQDRGATIDVYALGVLTHYTEADCQQQYRRSLSDAVRFFAEQAEEAGVSGYIQPGTHLHVTSDLPIKKLVPAVRPSWFEDKKANAQELVVTPEEARRVLAWYHDPDALGNKTTRESDTSGI